MNTQDKIIVILMLCPLAVAVSVLIYSVFRFIFRDWLGFFSSKETD